MNVAMHFLRAMGRARERHSFTAMRQRDATKGHLKPGAKAVHQPWGHTSMGEARHSQSAPATWLHD